VRPPIEFGVKYCEVEGMVAGSSAEPSPSSLHPISLDEPCPADVESCKYFREVVGVRLAGLIVWVPPSRHVWIGAGFEVVREFSFFFTATPRVASQSVMFDSFRESKRGEVEVVQVRVRF
jgi:hypothetical protein